MFNEGQKKELGDGAGIAAVSLASRRRRPSETWNETKEKSCRPGVLSYQYSDEGKNPGRLGAVVSEG